jgi:phosphoribosylaminoimidazolecarboxamide formyltransferase/IMP cyclohydrolase
MTIKRALISVTDKHNLHILGPYLQERGVEVISTGGTLKYLKQHSVKAIDIAKFTGQPEIMDGRVKTLHGNVFGGILGRRGIDDDLMTESNILQIDLVVVNLYKFSDAIAKPGCTMEDAIESIDIGGPSLLRAAAKNYKDVVVLCDPDDYSMFMTKNDFKDGIDLEQRLKYAQKVFTHTGMYDTTISQYMFHKLFKAI